MSQNDDMISRQEAKEAYCKHFCHLYCYRDTLCSDNLCKEVNGAFDKLPPAQRNGTWITDVNDNNNAYCSECGLLTTKDLLKRIALVGENKPKFCPNCGAKMEDKGVVKIEFN